MSELPPITATDVAYFLGCPHTYTRKLGGAWPHAIEPSPLDRAVMDYGLEHERRIARQLNWPEVPDQRSDFATAHRLTLDLLRSGASGVYQGVFELPPYRGKPDLLRRIAGQSQLGDWLYEPGDIKSSTKTRGEQIVQVVFYALLLEQVQGVRPNTGFIILRDGSEERFQIGDYDLAVLATLDEMLAIRSGRTEPPDLHLHRGCGSCRWRQTCSQEAIDRDDVSLVPNIPRAYRQSLLNAGIRTASEFANLGPLSLDDRSGLPSDWLQAAAQRARARLTRVVQPIGDTTLGDRPSCSIAVVWLTDILARERTVVLLGYQVRQANGRLEQARIGIAASNELATATALEMATEIERASERLARPPILVSQSAQIGDLVATLKQDSHPWVEQLLDIDQMARRYLAFPAEIEGPGSMLAQLRGNVPEPPLPFCVASPRHPVLAYSLWRERARRDAHKEVVDWARGELMTLHGLYDALRGAP